MQTFAALISLGLLAGCAGGQGLVEDTPAGYLAERSLVASPTPSRFSFCLEHGCRRVLVGALSEADWRTIQAPLQTPAEDAAAERRALAAAVARFEQATRRTLRLGADLAGTYPGAFSSDQNDCVDETANTTTFLLMLDREGLLRRHTVGAPARRGAFIDIALPHRSATIQEAATGQRFVLDSWFRESGAPADIAPLDA